jgi:hypothetical protein
VRDNRVGPDRGLPYFDLVFLTLEDIIHRYVILDQLIVSGLYYLTDQMVLVDVLFLEFLLLESNVNRSGFHVDPHHIGLELYFPDAFEGLLEPLLIF